MPSHWLGDATVGKGVVVGEGAIVGARSALLADIPPNCLAMGNPATVVGFAGVAATTTMLGSRAITNQNARPKPLNGR